MYEDTKLKRAFVIGLFVVALAFIGIAWWLHETAFEDPTSKLAFYVVGAIGCVCFMFGIVAHFIRDDIDI
jgi:nitrate reductase gamma subunit